MKNILVTGGSGFIGSYLVKRLVDNGYSVRVLDNNSRGSVTKLGEYINKVDFVEGDICRYEDVLKAADGVDTLFHLAFINGTRFFYEMPEKVLEVAVKGAVHTLDAVLQHRIPRYILASSSEVYQQPTQIPTPETERAIIPDILNPRFSYGGGKLISELMAIHYARKYGFSASIFRPHNVYGPDMGSEHVIPELFFKLKKASRDFQNPRASIKIQGTGKESRSFCYIDDFIDGILICAEQGASGEIYHIGNDTEEVEILDLIHRIAGFLQLEVDLVEDALPTGGTTRRCPDIRKMRGLGFKPKISLNEGLRRTLAWYKAQFDGQVN